MFGIATGVTLTAGSDFVVAGNAQATILNMVTVINATPGLVAIPGNGVLTIFQDSLSLPLTITYSGSQNIVASGPLGDQTSIQPNQPGPYVYDLTQNFTISNIGTTLTQEFDETDPRVFQVADASQFPDAQGYLIFGYGTEQQEGPVPYVGRPSNNTLLISSAYNIKIPHGVGTDVALVSSKAPAVISADGLDYPFYITDVVSGRVYAESLLQSIAATGINIVFTVLYPNSIGLGKWHTPYDEISEIYGP